MRGFIATLSLGAIISSVAPPAVAGQCLDLVTFDGSWSAVPFESRGATMVWLGLENNGDEDVVMVEGTATFVDALGNAIEPFPMVLDPDVRIPAHGGEVAELFPEGTSRLISVDESLITASVCITAVVTQGGAVIRIGD
jgi:hypothetical protein